MIDLSALHENRSPHRHRKGNTMKIFGREPAVIVGAIQAVMVLAVSFGWLQGIGLRNQDDIALVVGVLTALSAVYLAYVTSETLLAPVIELFKAALAMAAIYNFHLTLDQTAAAVATITTVLSLVQRTQASPLVVPSFELNPPKAA